MAFSPETYALLKGQGGGGGSSGGNGVFLITFTDEEVSPDQWEMVADKTPQEIASAYTDGKVIFGFYDGILYRATSFWIEDSQLNYISLSSFPADPESLSFGFISVCCIAYVENEWRYMQGDFSIKPEIAFVYVNNGKLDMKWNDVRDALDSGKMVVNLKKTSEQDISVRYVKRVRFLDNYYRVEFDNGDIFVTSTAGGYPEID